MEIIGLKVAGFEFIGKGTIVNNVIGYSLSYNTGNFYNVGKMGILSGIVEVEYTDITDNVFKIKVDSSLVKIIKERSGRIEIKL